MHNTQESYGPIKKHKTWLSHGSEAWRVIWRVKTWICLRHAIAPSGTSARVKVNHLSSPNTILMTLVGSSNSRGTVQGELCCWVFMLIKSPRPQLERGLLEWEKRRRRWGLPTMKNSYYLVMVMPHTVGRLYCIGGVELGLFERQFCQRFPTLWAILPQD